MKNKQLPELLSNFALHQLLKIAFSDIACQLFMAEREFKEKVKIDDDKVKVERESKDEFGNKIKEKHEVKAD
jgi:hypothetical protein